jgi:hypothetical protein
VGWGGRVQPHAVGVPARPRRVTLSAILLSPNKFKELCREFYADLAPAGPLEEILGRLQRRRRGENVPAPLALELSARPRIMKITKRTQSNFRGSYSKAKGSCDFGVFFACETNPKLPANVHNAPPARQPVKQKKGRREEHGGLE